MSIQYEVRTLQNTTIRRDTANTLVSFAELFNQTLARVTDDPSETIIGTYKVFQNDEGITISDSMDCKKKGNIILIKD